MVTAEFSTLKSQIEPMDFIIPHLRTKTLVLASQSPRRQELVKALGLPVVVRTREVNEHYPSTLPVAEVATFLAELKAEPLLSDLGEDEILLTGDTTVVLDDQVLNKPADRAEAEWMLRQLSGRSHEVITGVCMVYRSERTVFSDRAEVRISALDERLIESYLDSGSPFDKAGAYGAQDDFGKLAIESVYGSFYTVMGFPIHLIYKAMKAL